MGFQTTVIGDIRSGVIGEIAFNGPTRAVSAMLDSGAGAANNVVGRAFCYASTENNTVKAGGDAGIFAGILIQPKSHALRGTAVGGTLADSLTVPDGVAVELLQMGEVFVSLATDGATIGSLVKYDDTTGVLDHGAASTGETQVPNATVVRVEPSPTAAGAYLAVIRLTN
jgi:hypothetical protein